MILSVSPGRRRPAGSGYHYAKMPVRSARPAGREALSVKTPVYLDYAATTPADPAVVAAMTRYLGPDGAFGNAASRLHSFGREAEEAVEQARVQVAELINADPREIVWTSGATESNNLAIKGVAAQAGRGAHVVTSAIEHKAVLDPCLRLERSGFEITRIEPGNDGLISPDRVLSALRDDTILLSLMHVNNEIGAVTDVETIGRTARDRGVPFHVDAAQSAARLPLDVERQHADFVSLSGHKMYGPKGVGPWIVAYFGGKDSTLLLQLVWEAAAAAGTERRRPIYVVSKRHPGRIAAGHRPPAAEPRRHPRRRPRRRSAGHREDHRAVHRPDVLGQRDRPGVHPPDAQLPLVHRPDEDPPDQPPDRAAGPDPRPRRAADRHAPERVAAPRARDGPARRHRDRDEPARRDRTSSACCRR